MELNSIISIFMFFYFLFLFSILQNISSQEHGDAFSPFALDIRSKMEWRFEGDSPVQLFFGP